MSDNENSFTHDGVEYVAVESNSGYCNECALHMLDYSCIEESTPHCFSSKRKDAREVIFKKKVNLEME